MVGLSNNPADISKIIAEIIEISKEKHISLEFLLKENLKTLYYFWFGGE